MKPRTRFPNIYLVGPNGAGKSTIGKRLAALTDLHYIDTDEEVCARSGVDINWIFEVEGESGFRKRESNLIAELCQCSNMLISTGGGSVVNADNRRYLHDTGMVIYLQVSFEKQHYRTLQRRKTRPLLETGESFRENLLALNKQRESLYSEIAHHTYNTDAYDPQALARQIYQDILQQNHHDG